MPTPKMSDALLQEMVNVVATHKTQSAASAALGLPHATLQARLRMAKTRGIKPNGGLVAADDVQALQAKVKRLESALTIASRSSADVNEVKRVIGTLSLNTHEYTPPPWINTQAGKVSAPGVPTLMLSDWHGGEVVYPAQINGVNEYNVRIMRERAHHTIETAIELLRIINPAMDYPGIVMPLGGDMISGNIHDELTATNELNSMPAVLELFGILTGAIERAAEAFGYVFLPCVSGNHGRDTRKIWNKDRHHTSFDWLLYQFLARRFANDKRVMFFIPDSSDAYYKIYSHAYLLTHGDQFRGGDGMIGCLGPILRGDHKKRSRNAQVDMEYDTMIMGHWHQYIHHGRVIVNGSLKGYDEYAYNNNFGYEEPKQALWLTHPRNGITFAMPVLGDRKRAPAKTEWISVPASAK